VSITMGANVDEPSGQRYAGQYTLEEKIHFATSLAGVCWVI
jgi:hypothetical protein